MIEMIENKMLAWQKKVETVGKRIDIYTEMSADCFEVNRLILI
jgi:GH25 family lysozyme M1 (1,4-beta-N-acetylmuramidase)